jgi:hypothetical protein
VKADWIVVIAWGMSLGFISSISTDILGGEEGGEETRRRSIKLGMADFETYG